MSHGLGLMIESLVALLLLLTIGYCVLLNHRLKRLRADELSVKELRTQARAMLNSASLRSAAAQIARELRAYDAPVRFALEPLRMFPGEE